MATLIKNGSFPTALHEWCHSWYQMMLGTNEHLYAWMDEGFTGYAQARVFSWLHKTNFFNNAEEYPRYFNLAGSIYDEPMSTPANFYKTNLAYNVNAYYKGAVFLRQLGYIVGEGNVDKILLQYYKQWRFKHPTPNDFIQIAEKTSDMQLKWYKDFMVNTIKTIDYSIDSLWDEGGKTKIRIRRVGEMPMPIDVQLTFKDGSRELHYIPLNLMYGQKPIEDTSVIRKSHEEWRWTHPTYVFESDHKIFDLSEVHIDPTQRLADIDKRNNLLKIKW
jgi:aminopeptidase N